MQSLRIALGLFALVLVFFLIVPAEPTLFTSRPDAEPAPVSTAAALEPVPIAAASDAPSPAAPVRAIGPVPVAATGLTRLPPATSGAATPPKADEMAAPTAATEAPPEPAETATSATVSETEATPASEPTGPAARLFARPIAVDAGTLKSGEFTLFVEGVEPVPNEARCTEGVQTWPCATRARTALRSWLRGRSVQCVVPPEATEAREITASCELGEEDVGDWVVRNGWARAAPGGRYEAAEAQAREARRGVWAYGFGEEASAPSGR